MKTKKITTIAMFCALAFLVSLIKLPFNGFLDLELKSAVITICAFVLGLRAGFIISLIVPLIEMFLSSATGPIGLLMNIIATCAFVCPAAFVYEKRHNMKGAIIGLIAGSALLTISMLLWNYIITPIYMNVPREVVVGMLVPVLLPFNLIKAASNMAVTLLLYKPIVNALRKSGLLPESTAAGKSGKRNTSVTVFAIILLLTCVFLVLAFKGII